MNMDEFGRALDVTEASTIRTRNGGLAMIIIIKNWRLYFNRKIQNLEEVESWLKEYGWLGEDGDIVLDESKFKSRELFEPIFGIYFWNLSKMIQGGTKINDKDIDLEIRERISKIDRQIILLCDESSEKRQLLAIRIILSELIERIREIES